MSAIGDRGIGHFRDHERQKFESNFCKGTLYLLSNNLGQVVAIIILINAVIS